MAISRRNLSRLSNFEPQASNLQIPWLPCCGRLIANADASSIGILSDQRRRVSLIALLGATNVLNF
jgi:hypothetical protein